ncbi:putative MPP superfamily phosphohydrolase [Stackebrandtia endophytica]|uniref:Putative MPP superfamily phosphohydrolase n=1 Tax=Stackebrandtia endophytica TaxID=1496996 RepID=A0A543ARQ3_9ACTN|nr:metallophosphoesterase [Stackebrandtia endophytica]TQL75262.1 putative MPP superfamily phosphohydrolase [Stackebrandtia endophytica]
MFTFLALIAATVGVFVGGVASVDVGPFRTTMAVQPSTTGESEVYLPPLGSLIFDSHDAPLRLTLRLDSLDQSRTEALIADPTGVEKASATVPNDLLIGITDVTLGAIAGAMLLGIILGALVFRSRRRAVICGALSLVVALSGLGLAASSIRPESITEPRYEGLLANAPAVVGSAQNIADRYEKYREQLQQFIVNMSQFYTIARTLPAFEPDPGTIRVLHVSDLHLNPAAWDVIESVTKQFQINMVIDTGDITDWGTQQEAATYTEGIRRITAPYLYIRGNHDSGKTADIIAEQTNAIVLDGEVVEVDGLRIGGIGDPRFTPDKSAKPSDWREEQVMLDNGIELRDNIIAEGGADVALVHDPVSAGPLADVVPLVLSGHRHQRQSELISDETLLLVQGSTGGAGLRGLQQDTPVPLQLSVMYFDSETKLLQAFDDISVGGVGETEVTLQRHILTDGLPDDASDLFPSPEEVEEAENNPSLEPDSN